ncbi:MAG: ABC transporter permease [Synergistaceae bacterium]|jgi:ribose transport system permease protein|nr:ABC transporter permease [Synergistaceae bacterium]
MSLFKTGGRKMPEFVGPLMAVLALAFILSVTTERFLSLPNIMNILRQTAINALIALGMLMVMLTGGIDLSVGSTAVLSGCVMGVLLKNGVTNEILLILAGLGTGILAGTLNALLYTRLELPHPFVSTMGTRMMYRGLALFITGAAPIAGFSTGILFLGYRNLFKVIPSGFVLVIILYTAINVMLTRTALGRKIYSVGGNREAARLSGINVKWVLNYTYIMSGLMSSIAGIVLLGRISSASPIASETADMDAIASCVVGGTSFLGGKGTVAGTLAGAMLIGVINNGLDLLGAQTDSKYIVIGSVIICAVFLDVVRNKTEEKGRRLAQARSMSERDNENP